MVADQWREWGEQLTRLPSLEILDLSKNRITALPEDLGTLMKLKVGDTAGWKGGGG